MSPETFIHWLRGFVSASHHYNLTPAAWDELKKNLEDVVIDNNFADSYLNLSRRQRVLFEKWKNTIPEPKDNTLTGGLFTFTITPTSIGEVVRVVAWNGSELDLTEY